MHEFPLHREMGFTHQADPARAARSQRIHELNAQVADPTKSLELAKDYASDMVNFVKRLIAENGSTPQTQVELDRWLKNQANLISGVENLDPKLIRHWAYLQVDHLISSEGLV